LQIAILISQYVIYCQARDQPRFQWVGENKKPQPENCQARGVNGTLFRADRSHRIDFSGSSSRNVARCQRHNYEQDGNANKRRWIGGPDAEQDRRQHPCRGKGAAEPEHNARRGQAQALPDHMRNDMVALRSQGPPNSDVPRPLQHRIRNDVVRSQVLAIDRDQPVWEVTTVDAVVERSEGRLRLMMRLLGTFAGSAALLAVIGLYGIGKRQRIAIGAHDQHQRLSRFL
jgi:hypothetical protein